MTVQPSGTGESDDRDAALMLQVGEGDEQAFLLLVERYRDRVMALAYRYVRDASDAEDVAQEVFLNVYRARAGYRPEAKFSTWLFRIATNLSLNAIRSRVVRRRVRRLAPTDPDEDRRRIEEVPDRTGLSAAEEIERRELAVRVREIVDELPENQKTAVLLNKYEGLSYEEVSEVMAMSIPAVKSLLCRARMRIKERLLPYLQSERVP